MPIYIALLRGINVGPHKRMKMDKLRLTCEGAGFEKVCTYIQSGNIVFIAARLSPAALEKKLGEAIARDFDFSCDVIVRSREELKKIIETNPLLKESDVDPAKLHVVFLAEEPGTAAMKKLQEIILAPDHVRTCGREIYFYFPNGVSSSSLWKHPLDKVVAVSGTMRNWNTVTKLFHMAQELE